MNFDRSFFVWISLHILSLFPLSCVQKIEDKDKGTTQSNNVVQVYFNKVKQMADADMVRNPEARMPDFNRSPGWNYTHGVICTTEDFLPNETECFANAL